MTDQERIARLEREVESQLGIIAGLTSVATALVRSHPDADRLKGEATKAIELMDVGSIGKTMTEKQRLLAREVAEQTLRTGPTR